jgi:hypothetical protein
MPSELSAPNPTPCRRALRVDLGVAAAPARSAVFSALGTAAANAVAGSLIWCGEVGVVMGLVVLLGGAAAGGFLLRTWSWPPLYPVPAVLMGVWLLQQIDELNAEYEATGVGSMAPVAAVLLGFLCFAAAGGLLVVSAIAVAVGKRSGRQ